MAAPTPPASPSAPSNPAAALVEAEALLADEQAERARSTLVEARRRWPRDERLALRLLDVLKSLGDVGGVRAHAADVLQSGAASSDFCFSLGSWAEERGGLVSAARAFARAARLAADDPEPVVRLARVLRRAGRADLAERAVRRALASLGDAAALHAALGYAFVDAHRPAAAALAFGNAVRLEPTWPAYREDLAYALVLSERWREAAEAARAAVKAAPRSERGWTALATACSALQQREVADWAYRQALEVARDPSRTQGNYGLFLADDEARLLEAGRHLRAAAEAHPDWEEVQTALAGLGKPRA